MACELQNRGKIENFLNDVRNSGALQAMVRQSLSDTYIFIKGAEQDVWFPLLAYQILLSSFLRL